ncbi:sensor domain-containing diguanylate cyclase [Candidatus Stoquefichus massiliensis]|uniref:sensor domain-containing diguanylate cyclase n=1 Tax=Candidatus Stoquefichus massiliensis TaxID=1470350 RepID=UPI000480C238|nr:sensor domain-containing diguanylate cyclase [Candidatus Stoquefichus massiliensis]
MICIFGNIYSSLRTVHSNSVSQLHDISNVIGSRIQTTIQLLESIRYDEIIGNTQLSLKERAEKLKVYSNAFHYKIMGITDEEINVYSSNDKAGNLARRDFMQKLYSTGETQVTNIYSAGENGSLLIYTIAVPIFKDEKVVGSVWASLAQNELEEIILSFVKRNQSDDFVLFGSENTVLASSEEGTYDTSLDNLNQGSTLFGGNIKTVNQNLKDRKSGHYYGFKNGKLWYASYQNIEQTPWTIMFRGNIFSQMSKDIGGLVSQLLIIIIIGYIFDVMMRKHMKESLSSWEATIASIQAMNLKIRGEKAEMNTQDILDITSQGLIDSLTGTATRTVFANSIVNKLKSANPDKLSVLCFIDLDNLKTLNDTFGHEEGDKALANIGYCLRKLEKIYDGITTRYGGDEFLLFIPNLKSRKEVENLLHDIIVQLDSELNINENKHSIHCSIGASLYPNDATTIKDLIAKADKALYKAKHRGKNTYCIFDEM